MFRALPCKGIAEVICNIAQGNNKAQIEALTLNQLALFFVAGTLDVAVGLYSSNSQVTPAIDQISFTYRLPGGMMAKDDEFDIYPLNATQTKVKNTSGSTLADVRVQVAI